jgi:release factor glutamine methyltransferase
VDAVAASRLSTLNLELETDFLVTLSDFLQAATVALAATSPTPRLDAEVLAMYVTGLPRTGLITRAGDALSPEQEARLQSLVERRTQGEPIAYLTGTREFWSLELAVTPDVLIPRPETELLVEQALARIPPDAAWQIADLGTGSGAIALAIASERRRCRIVATDASEAALDVARTNARRLGIGNVEFRHGEWFAPLTGLAFDLIASNPPYIAATDPHLAQGDVRFEPHSALVSGPDGLDAIRRIAAQSPAHLVTGGWLLLEHGYDQAAAVQSILRTSGLTDVASVADLAGHGRVTAGRRAKATA